MTGASGSMEIFRQMCDEGFSTRERNVRKEYRKVTQPKQASFENLKKVIVEWGADLLQLELATGKRTDDKDRILCLEDICPYLLQQDLERPENFRSYSDYKLAINCYLANRARWAGRGRVNWLGVAEGFLHDIPEQDGGDEPDDAELAEQVEALCGKFPQLSAISVDISAVVKSRLGKKGKGGGKGARKAAGKSGGAGDVIPGAGGGGQDASMKPQRLCGTHAEKKVTSGVIALCAKPEF